METYVAAKGAVPWSYEKQVCLAMLIWCYLWPMKLILSNTIYLFNNTLRLLESD